MLLLLTLCSANAEPFSFAVVGDPQTDGAGSSINWEQFPAVVDGANTQGATYLLVAGDLVGGSSSLSATVSQWGDFELAAGAFLGEVYMVPGNHDVYGGSGTFEAWRETFDWLPTDDSPPGEEGVSYYLDHDNTRFIFVTSDHPSNQYRLSDAGLTWLDRVLSESEALEHVFVITHHPVTFSAENNHGGTGGDFWKTLVAYGVDGLFTGHWHRYQPSRPGGGGATWETIIGTGGGWQGFDPIRPYQQIPGFLLVTVDGEEALATFYGDEDGDGDYDDAIDSYTLASPDDPRLGLVGRYTFDGAAPTDSAPTGKAVDGVLYGDAALVAGGGVSGGALHLDGGYDYMEAGAIGDYVMAVNGDVTLSAWVRAEAVSSDSGYGSVLMAYATNDYYTEDEETNYAWYLSLRPDGSLTGFWEHGDGANVQVVSTVSSALLDGEWHHVALTRDAGALEARFYEDGGQLGGAVSYTHNATGGGRGMVYLGSDTPSWAGLYDFGGLLDEICVFDSVLTPEQISGLAALEDCEAVLVEEAPEDTGGSMDSADSADITDTAETSPGGETDEVSDTDTDSVDPGATGDGADVSLEKGGCGCAARPGDGASGWFVLLALAGVFRRRCYSSSSSRSRVTV